MPSEERDALLNAQIPGMNQKVGAPPKGAAVSALGDAVTADDFQMSMMLQRLQEEMSGTALNPDGSRFTREQVVYAEQRYMQLREFADMQRAQREAEAQQRRDRQVAEEKNRLEEERNRIQEGEVAGRLAIEQQKIEIEKAKVMVDAFVRIGSDPAMSEKFGPMLEALSQKLLSGSSIGVSGEEVTKLRLISTAAKPVEPNGSGQ